MKRHIRGLALSALVLAMFAGDSVRASACSVTPTESLCVFFGLLNSPSNASLSADNGDLVVCNLGGANDVYGVHWIDPSRTGHEDWIDLGRAKWKRLDPPAVLVDAVVSVQSDANFVSGNSETVEALMNDIGAEIEISTDFNQVKAASVTYEVYQTVGGGTPDHAETVSDSVANPIIASDWPTVVEFSRYTFPAPGVTIRFPSGQIETGIRELGLKVNDDADTEELASVDKVSVFEENTKTPLPFHAPQGAGCPSGFRFVIEDVGLGSLTATRRLPAVSPVGVTGLVALAMAVMAVALWRRRRHRETGPR